jgi:hypothetical protein
MNNELERIWKKSCLDFRYCPRMCLWMVARSMENNLKITSILVKNQTDHLISTKQKHCNLS